MVFLIELQILQVHVLQSKKTILKIDLQNLKNVKVTFYKEMIMLMNELIYCGLLCTIKKGTFYVIIKRNLKGSALDKFGQNRLEYISSNFNSVLI